MKKSICFYDRVIVQRGEHNTILHNANAMLTDKVTTEVYDLLCEVCDTGTYLSDVFEMIESKEDQSYFSKVLERLFQKKIIKYTDEVSEYLNMDIQIDFDLTNRCNLRCRHCCVSADNCNTDLSTDKMFEAVDKILSLKPVKLVISGGEPLVRKDFRQIINRIRDGYNGELSLMTNAILVDDEMADFIAAKFDSVAVSLDGVDEETCSIIRGAGTFDKTMEGIKRLQRAGVEKISASMVVTSVTNDKKEAFNDMCNQMGVTPILRALALVGRAKDTMSEYVLEVEEASEEELYNQVSAADDIIASGNYIIFSCGAGYKQFQIDYKGDIYPCQSLMEDELVLGNIFYVSDLNSYIRNREFTSTSGYKLIEKYFPYNYESCKGCNKQIFCWNCIAELYRESGELRKCHFCNMAYDRFFV